MSKLSFREAVGVKIAIAILRDLISISRERCIDVDRLLWLLDELDRSVDRSIRYGLAPKALEVGRTLGEEILAAEKR